VPNAKALVDFDFDENKVINISAFLISCLGITCVVFVFD